MVIPRASPPLRASNALATACMHPSENRPSSQISLYCHEIYGGTGLTVPYRLSTLKNRQSTGNSCSASETLTVGVIRRNSAIPFSVTLVDPTHTSLSECSAVNCISPSSPTSV